uniref:Uncharacterized protein n=1 Tax=Arundo donax TaxID=35708 RepID=A0A0A9D9H5_ARUDO
MHLSIFVLGLTKYLMYSSLHYLLFSNEQLQYDDNNV